MRRDVAGRTMSKDSHVPDGGDGVDEVFIKPGRRAKCLPRVSSLQSLSFAPSHLIPPELDAMRIFGVTLPPSPIRSKPKEPSNPAKAHASGKRLSFGKISSEKLDAEVSPRSFLRRL